MSRSPLIQRNPQTIGQVLLEQAARIPDRDALVVDDDRLTYGALAEDSIAIARGLVSGGTRPGDHVALFMPSCLDFVRSMMGAFLAGLVVVPINARYRRQELGHVIGHSDATSLFTTDVAEDHVDLQGRIIEALDESRSHGASPYLEFTMAPRLRRILVFGDGRRSSTLPIQQLLESGNLTPWTDVKRALDARQPEDTAIIMYTSGTTALPKGCEISHAGLLEGWRAYASRMGLGDGDRLWAPCPMFHLSGFGPLLAAVAVGATLISQQHVDADRSLKQIREESPTHLHPAFPQITLGLVRHPDYRPNDLIQAKALLNLASVDLQREIQELLPADVVLMNCFGMTEGSGIITMTEQGDPLEERVSSAGHALDGVELRVVDEGEECAIGEVGEIEFRGFNSFKRYYKDEDQTRLAIDDQGWVRTGDLGVLDSMGRLTFVSRAKDMLKVGGENVAPTEIESLLGTHPAVEMAQIVGRSDDHYGEVPVAFVELRRGQVCTSEELIEYCRDRIARFKVPREVRFLTEWPMSATKIQKSRLRAML